ncbi:MAG: M2 family metallopeptidase [Myxococcota bacterium]
MTTPTTVLLALLCLLLACGEQPAPDRAPEPAPARAPETEPAQAESAEERAQRLLALYTPLYAAVRTEVARANWVASTDVSEEHTGLRTGAGTAYSALTGNAELIRQVRSLMERRAELEPQTARQLREILLEAAGAPMTNPELARARVAKESEVSAILDGYQFCLARDGESCAQPVTTNDLDRVLVESRDLGERRAAWEASKEVGAALRDGLLELRDLRNGVAKEMGFGNFFALQVANYDMSSDEMITLLDQLLAEMQPLVTELHCWVRHTLAERYGQEVPERIPAHWLGNRWAQSWPGLAEGVDLDALVEGKEPSWLVEQAERFYTSMGLPDLPESFFTESDLYPVGEGDLGAGGEARRKNAHASAWHLDLEQDVRSLMSVETNWRWFETTHHELGHIYYYLLYARDEVPLLLRGGANRSFHEGVGELISLASGQPPYLREVELLRGDAELDEEALLLDQALTGPVVFLPFAVGVMSHYEYDLYAGELSAEELNARWWAHVARYQGVVPPEPRDPGTCDACTKTHIMDDPAQYYDYALATVLRYQLHEHICQELLEQDPHACNYFGRQEVGAFLREVMEPGATLDWREHLEALTGEGLTAEPMLRYFAPLKEWLATENEGRSCAWPS